MEGIRFDAFAMALVARGSRRGVLHALVSGSLGFALGGARGQTGEAACKRLGKACEQSGDCCAGARCKSGKCRCQANRFPCGPRCCAAGQSCQLLSGGWFCLNGPKQPGDPCDRDAPGECASGECGCYSATACYCRNATCGPPGAGCDGLIECCRGVCDVTPCGSLKKCAALPGEKCGGDCECFGVAAACRGGRCCRTAGGGCDVDAHCCGRLVCLDNACVQQQT